MDSGRSSDGTLERCALGLANEAQGAIELLESDGLEEDEGDVPGRGIACGDDDDRDRREVWIGALDLAKGPTVHVGHHEVEQHEDRT